MDDFRLLVSKNNEIVEEKKDFNTNDFLSLIEKAYSERDKVLSSYSNLKSDYNNLQKDYNSLQMKLNSLEENIIKLKSKSSFSEKKLNDNISLLFSTEKKLYETTNKNDVLSHTNSLLENQVSQFKGAYLDYKERSSKEISFLNKNLEETQKEKEDLLKNNTSLKRE